MPGNGWIEVVLWACYIAPGLIYSIWRRSKKSTICAACGSKNTVPLSTPAGKRLAAQHYPDGVELEEIEIPPPAKPIRGGFIILVAFLGFFLMLMVSALIKAPR